MMFKCNHPIIVSGYADVARVCCIQPLRNAQFNVFRPPPPPTFVTVDNNHSRPLSYRYLTNLRCPRSDKIKHIRSSKGMQN